MGHQETPTPASIDDDASRTAAMWAVFEESKDNEIKGTRPAYELARVAFERKQEWGWTQKSVWTGVAPMISKTASPSR